MISSQLKEFRENIILKISEEPLPHVSFEAAKYLAVIVYPDDTVKRTEFVNACRAWMLKGMMGGQLKSKYIYKEDILEFAETRKMEAQFKKAEKIIADKRAPALLAFKLKFLTKAIPVHISGGEEFTLDKWFDKCYPTKDNVNASEHNKRNAYYRIWKPSKSIIHLVAGFENAIQDKQIACCIEDLLINPAWLSEALEIAENLRKMILLHKPFKIKAYEQIRMSAI